MLEILSLMSLMMRLMKVLKAHFAFVKFSFCWKLANHKSFGSLVLSRNIICVNTKYFRLIVVTNDNVCGATLLTLTDTISVELLDGDDVGGHNDEHRECHASDVTNSSTTHDQQSVLNKWNQHIHLFFQIKTKNNCP